MGITLLTISQVAKLLNISKVDVYENKERLGGFYPAGYRVLFRSDVIEEIIKERNLPFSTPRAALVNRRAYRRGRTGRAVKGKEGNK